MAREGKEGVIDEATEFVHFLQSETIRAIHGQTTKFPGPVWTDASWLRRKLQTAGVEPETIGRFDTATRIWAKIEHEHSDGGM